MRRFRRLAGRRRSWRQTPIPTLRNQEVPEAPPKRAWWRRTGLISSRISHGEAGKKCPRKGIARPSTRLEEMADHPARVDGRRIAAGTSGRAHARAARAVAEENELNVVGCQDNRQKTATTPCWRHLARQELANSLALSSGTAP